MVKSTGIGNGNQQPYSPIANELVASLNKRALTAPKCACRILLLIFVFGVAATAASAQVLYGSLTGTVTDPTGAAIPNASVQIQEVDKGITQQTTVDGSGFYRLNNVLPGTYKITTSASGFATSIHERIDVGANAVQRLDVKLNAGAVSENVTVTATPPLLQMDRSDVQTNISSAEIAALPAVSSEGRNFQALLKIVPGAGIPMESNSASGNPQRAMTTNVNGQSSQGNSTLLDGVPDAYPWLPNNIAYVPPSDAIENVNIVTNAFDAEQGQVGGALVNVQTKSGTNAFHGDVHYLFTNNTLRNFNYFTLPGTRKPLNIFHQYGAGLGGPIVKDKLFFFANWESTRQTQAPSGGNPQTVPTGGLLYATAKQNGFFDFRGLQKDKNGNAVHIYDPRTGNANGTNRQPISCNGVVDTLCFSETDPAALTMASLIPEPNASGTTNNFIDTQKGFFHRDDYDGKVNWVPNSTTNAFARYSYSSSDIFDPPALGDAGGNATLGGQQGNSTGGIHVVGLGMTHTFTPHLLLDMNGGFTRQKLQAENVDIAKNGAFGLNTLKIPGTNDPSNQLYWGIPAFQFATFSNLGGAGTGNPFLFRDNQYLGGANVTWVRNRHNVRGGIAYTHVMLNHFQPQGGTFQTARGTFGFSGASTEQVTCNGNTCSAADPPTTLQFGSYADFLLGLPFQVGKAVQNSNVNGLRWSTWAFYARDQWQITPKLSLTYGLRWEYYPMAYSDHGGARVLDTSTMNVLIGGNGGVPVDNGVDVGHGLFLPRVGIAYRATEKTVLRAGYGINADSNNWRFLRNAYPAATISTFVGTTYTQAGGSGFAPGGTLTGFNAVGPYSYLPAGITLIPIPDISSGKIPLANNTGTTTIPLNFRRGYMHSYNAAIEQQFPGDFVSTISYVGSRAIRPLTNMNVNPAPFCLPGSTSCNVTLGTAGRILNSAFHGTWGDINQLTPYGNNYYDALQTRLTHRLASTSQVGIVYTWSKSINFQDNEELGFIIWPYPPYLKLNKALAGFDRTHNFQVYGIYDLPFGRGKRWATSGISSAVFGGWRLSGIFSAISGSPFNVTDTNSGTFNSPGNTLTPNLVAPINITRGKPFASPAACTSNACRYFDPSSFAHVAIPGVLGTTGRSPIRGPGYLNLDMTVNRDFKVTERLHFQFEASAFGVTNTPHFGNPTSDLNSSNFGKITSTLAVTNASLGGSGGERQWWFGGRITF